MNTGLLLAFILFLQQPEVPLKPSDEFFLGVERTFKERAATSNHSQVEFGGSDGSFDRKTNKGGYLPYLTITLRMLKLNEKEVRIKGVNNLGNNIINRKVDLELKVKMDLGFTADITDGVSPNEFTFYLQDQDRNPVSQIHMQILADGTFIVNNEIRGKF